MSWENPFERPADSANHLFLTESLEWASTMETYLESDRLVCVTRSFEEF